MSVKTSKTMVSADQLFEAITILREGGVIAYPTEAVFGLGCDPLDQKAVAKIRALKGREQDMGLILIASDWSQIQSFIGECTQEAIERAKASWPAPITWVFPASDKVPEWIAGPKHTVAVRITDHPVARALCDGFGSALVSTSANPTTQPPARCAEQAADYFANEVTVVDAECGGLDQPSKIFRAIDNYQLR